MEHSACAHNPKQGLFVITYLPSFYFTFIIQHLIILHSVLLVSCCIRLEICTFTKWSKNKVQKEDGDF